MQAYTARYDNIIPVTNYGTLQLGMHNMYGRHNIIGHMFIKASQKTIVSMGSTKRLLYKASMAIYTHISLMCPPVCASIKFKHRQI
jgi:hypothetical protein